MKEVVSCNAGVPRRVATRTVNTCGDSAGEATNRFDKMFQFYSVEFFYELFVYER